MKTLKTFLILSSLLFCLYACKKDNNTNPGAVAGRWNVVSVATRGVSQAGQPGDYFDFTANGTLYTKEGAALDTFNYTMRADTAIVLAFAGNPDALAEWGGITTFTAHSLVIDGPYPITPGGTMTGGSSITLSR